MKKLISIHVFTPGQQGLQSWPKERVHGLVRKGRVHIVGPMSFPFTRILQHFRNLPPAIQHLKNCTTPEKE